MNHTVRDDPMNRGSAAWNGHYTALVFDLDGTLIDSAPDLAWSVNQLLAEEQRAPLELEHIKTMIGHGARNLIERALTASGGYASDRSVDALTERFLEIYESHGVRETTVYPGVRETLSVIMDQDIQMGLCTNKPEQATLGVLEDLHLSAFFAAVVGGDTLAGIRKPDPRPLLAVLDRLGQSPDRAIYIGDSLTDVQTARAAGLRVVLREDGYTMEPAGSLGADAIFGPFGELPHVLAQLA